MNSFEKDFEQGGENEAGQEKLQNFRAIMEDIKNDAYHVVKRNEGKLKREGATHPRGQSLLYSLFVSTIAPKAQKIISMLEEARPYAGKAEGGISPFVANTRLGWIANIRKDQEFIDLSNMKPNEFMRDEKAQEKWMAICQEYLDECQKIEENFDTYDVDGDLSRAIAKSAR